MGCLAIWAMAIVIATLTSSVANATSRHSRGLEDDLWSDMKNSFRHVGEKHVLRTELPLMTDLLGDLHSASTGFDNLDREPLATDVDLTSDDKTPSLFPGGLFNLFNIGMRSSEPWWKGPNVCVEREEVDESLHKNGTNSNSSSSGSIDSEEDGIFGTFQFSTCQQTESKYICTTKVRNRGIRKSYVVKYQCCHGFQRVKGKPGCTAVHLKSMLETVESLGAKDFVQLLKSANLEEKISSQNLTLFVPSDDAVHDFTDSLQASNQVEFYVPPAKKKRSIHGGSNMKEILLSHITPGFTELVDFMDEEVLHSDNNSTIHINMYPNRVTTVNCARVISSNNHASTGVVHVIDRMLKPVTNTIAELLTQDPQFNTLATMIKKANLMKQLSSSGHFTLFAPTEQAFQKLDVKIRAKIHNGHACVANVIKHHLLPFTLCSAAISQELSVRNMGDDVLHIDRRLDDGKLFVSGKQIVAKDIMATNGIVHILDVIMIPDSASQFSDVLDTHNMTKFLGLLQEAGLTDSLDSMSNVTLFVPTNTALEEAKEVLEQVRADKDRLRDLLLYHTTGPEVTTCDMTNNMELKSGLADKSLRVALYSALPFFTSLTSRITVQCARMLHQDTKACGGVIHVVDRLLLPPKKSVLEIVNTDEKYSTLSSIIKGTGLEDELKESDPVTLLAPTDDVFAKLEEKDLKKLLEDKKVAKKMLKQHILPEAVCCSGVGATPWPFTSNVETLSSKSIPTRRDYEGRVHFGSTTVVDCDIMATNGIIHTVNRVMLPQDMRDNLGAVKFGGNPNLDIVLYGL